MRQVRLYPGRERKRKAVMLRPILIAALSMLAAAAGAQPTPPAPAVAPSSLEAQVLAALNEARTDPSGYAGKLRQYRTYFEDNVVHLPGSDVGLRTREGVVAVDQAIAFLARQKPVAALVAAPDLA